mmetsp:Transcript_38672/g.74158  ORF Transcript_38672/g.74158 Transcript_38672/m.74158 type:complete len:190 (+) Transcript_38672:486-1055(+)|eukprot:CAMPEP_0114252478 /NCGR_PEP_ID=MMETSP0058-20121206/15859_1 /TAXON_ID=36894 /ORGANISM="Pyramimonas parkeae, CCMP726" /LENGTH=189 /DNA_ID=CAMNT_0001366417 /DNA_START=443 /DNA_END=1012 /DNA_ORIENTATION=+
MGAFLSMLMSYFSPTKEHKILILGLDNAGKTTALYKLHLGEVVMTQPTVGCNVESITYKNLRFEVWDLGGQQSFRSTWSTYCKSTDAVIMMVDSTDRARVAITKDELCQLLNNEDLSSAVILVLANKQDLKDAMTAAEIGEQLCLPHIKSHNWHIQACCALTGEGLFDGLGWIAQQVALLEKQPKPLPF